MAGRAALWSHERVLGGLRLAGQVGGPQEEAGRLSLRTSKRSGRAGSGRLGVATVSSKKLRRWVDTQVRSRLRARRVDWAFATIYELSRSLHWEASWRAVRFAPIRISLLQ